MSNLPAPRDPNLLPSYQEAMRPYAQEVHLLEVALRARVSDDFLRATPPAYALSLRLADTELLAVTEGGTILGELELEPQALRLVSRLLESGKPLMARFAPPRQVELWLGEI